VEFVHFDTQVRHLLIGDFLSFKISSGIEFASYPESRFCLGSGNETHDHGQARQRTTSPILADEGKQPVLDLVPLARSGRQVTYK